MIKVFLSYAHEDEELRDELAKHLRLLIRKGIIQTWYDRDISPGMESAVQSRQQLETAKVILLLVSVDFIASDYCYDNELKQAMQRHVTGDAQIIPIILRPVEWRNTLFGQLTPLPKNGKPITSFSDRDAGFAEVAAGITRVCQELVQKEQNRKDRSAVVPEFIPRKRSSTRSSSSILPRGVTNPKVTNRKTIQHLPQSSWFVAAAIVAVWLAIGWVTFLDDSYLDQTTGFLLVYGAIAGLMNGFLAGLAWQQARLMRHQDSSILILWTLVGAIAGAFVWVGLSYVVGVPGLKNNGQFFGLGVGMISAVALLIRMNLKLSRP